MTDKEAAEALRDAAEDLSTATGFSTPAALAFKLRRLESFACGVKALEERESIKELAKKLAADMAQVEALSGEFRKMRDERDFYKREYTDLLIAGADGPTFKTPGKP